MQVVDSPEFVDMVRTLDPATKTMSRRTLGKRILAKHEDLEQHLINILEDVPGVATTADCWAAHHNSYLGVTLHWIDPASRQRKQAVLACQRLFGSHTFDVLARALSEIHCKFGIADKVRRTTTDNAANFVKAFVQFGDPVQEMPGDDRPAGAEDGDPDDLVDLLRDPDDAEAQPEAVSVEEVLSDADERAVNLLPAHARCAAHTFNLIATKDAEKALEDSRFRTVSRRALGKAQALWNAQNRSTNHADVIKAEVKKRLIVPNQTRWNSTFDAVAALCGFFTTHRSELIRAMTRIGVPTFTAEDIEYLKEYVLVMNPVAKALDKLQGESQAYLGCMLPTVTLTVMNLKNIKERSQLSSCKPLVEALLGGIERRFGPLLEDHDYLMAAGFHPKFR